MAINNCLVCKQPVYQCNKADAETLAKVGKDFVNDIIVTKCGHVFDRACLAYSLMCRKVCPFCNAVIRTLKDDCKPLTESMTLLSERYDEVKEHVITVLKDEADKKCSICIRKFKSGHVIPSKGFVHPGCWVQTPLEPPLPKLSPSQIAADEVEEHVRKGLEDKADKVCSICTEKFQSGPVIPESKGFVQTPPAPPPQFYPSQIGAIERLNQPAAAARAREEPKPKTAGMVILMAILLPMSLWALAMNWRFYQRRNVFLFVLSIPALLILKTCSLLFKGLRKVLTERPSY